MRLQRNITGQRHRYILDIDIAHRAFDISVKLYIIITGYRLKHGLHRGHYHLKIRHTNGSHRIDSYRQTRVSRHIAHTHLR